MEKKTKGDIKATLILLFYISIGLIGGLIISSSAIEKDLKVILFILGAALGMLIANLIKLWWQIIRMDIDN